ncbi:MAG: hypothetical protein ACTHLU_06545 [Novosphingobium sp.]
MRADLLRGRILQFALLLAVAVILRCDTFGDPNLHGDEVFYHQVGLALHDGVVPYVGVWDRKPFGLFALFYLITAISAAPLAYQLVATLFAAATAWIIAQMAQAWTRPLGGVLAGICYLLWLAPFQGFGGQSPVFYNLFVATAALLVQRALPRLALGERPGGVAAAMLLAGSAITIKTAAFAEAGFLGLICLITLLRSPLGKTVALRTGALWALLGLAPTLAIAAGYWLDGHWAEFWHAMVAANFAKPPSWLDAPLRAGIMLALLAPLLIPAVLGLVAQDRQSRRFVLSWLGAALLGLVALPNFYIHYALPLLVPLCLAASTFLARPLIGLATTAALAILALALAPIFQFDHTVRSRAAIAELTREIRIHRGAGPLLLYDAPPQLYRTSGQPFITPLVFPTHLSHLIERDVSQFSTLNETRRVLGLRPGAVAMAVYPRNLPANVETRQLVLAYVGRHCRLIRVIGTPERLGDAFIAVWGDCRG